MKSKFCWIAKVNRCIEATIPFSVIAQRLKKEGPYMNIDDWKSQIKRGTLEFCILLMIKKQPTYGYELINTLENYPILSAKENTIYPLLRRLLKEDYIMSSWQESTEGLPPRKYYSITDKGLSYISAMSVEWNNLLDAINKLKG